MVNQFIQDLAWTVKKPGKAAELTPTSLKDGVDARSAPAAFVAHLSFDVRQKHENRCL
jgi:hypothetical protein